MGDINYLYLAVIFTGSFIAAAVSGAAGFGGALLLLPMLSITIGTQSAVPILTLAQLIGNLARAFMGVKQISWKPVGLFVIGAIPAALIGARSFVAIPSDIATRIIGAAVIVFAALKYFNLVRFKPGKTALILGGALVGLLSGLIGSAGPIGAAIFLSLNLGPISYISSEAATAVAMHIVKTVVYQRYLGLSMEAIAIGLFMGFAMVLGTIAGKKLIEKMPKEKFVKFVGILMALVGLEMMIVGSGHWA